MRYPETPDGRYFVVRGRLWRCTNPELPEEERRRWTRELMSARRALRGEGAHPDARARVQKAKEALGERGPVWWSDGAPDFNRKMARNTPYAEWFEGLPSDRHERPDR